jgi:tryptophanyl-tRNA synthetase
MVEDDRELEELHMKCRSGQLMCGQCKKETADRVLSFVREMREKMAAVEHLIEV